MSRIYVCNKMYILFELVYLECLTSLENCLPDTIEHTSAKKSSQRTHSKSKLSVEEYTALKKFRNWPWAEGRPSE